MPINEEAVFRSSTAETRCERSRHEEALRGFLEGTTAHHQLTKESLLTNLNAALRDERNAALDDAAAVAREYPESVASTIRSRILALKVSP